MENDIGENLYMHHSAAAMQKMTTMQAEYMASMKNVMKCGIMWNKLGLTMAENGLNAMLSGMNRWSGVGMYYNRNIMQAFQPHEKRKIDRMVQEILKHA